MDFTIRTFLSAFSTTLSLVHPLMRGTAALLGQLGERIQLLYETIAASTPNTGPHGTAQESELCGRRTEGRLFLEEVCAREKPPRSSKPEEALRVWPHGQPREREFLGRVLVERGLES